MYHQQKVKIPFSDGGVTVKFIKGMGYVYYTTGRVYSSEEGRSNPIRVTIGKRCEDDPTKMIPNEKYRIYFADRMDDMKGKCEAEIEKMAKLVEKKMIIPGRETRL